MKILHTADWHLGKRLGAISRHDEQVLTMQEIVDIANEHDVDAVIVAGDLFDSFNPANESLELLYKTLKQLTNNGKRPVIAIAGNHDSPEKINAPEPLAKECGILLLGLPNAVPYAINSNNNYQTISQDVGFIEFKLNKYNYPLRLMLTPYANALRLKTYLNIQQEEQDLNNLLQAHWNAIAEKHCDDKGVNVLVGHQFFANTSKPNQQEPEGERPIMGLGGTNLIQATIVPISIQYVALGHLHEYQTIKSEHSKIVYSGSPCAYSFSEAEQEKHVLIATIQPNAQPEISAVQLKNPKVLYNKNFTSVETTLEWLSDNSNTLVNITLQLENFLTSTQKSTILKAHDGIVNLIPEVVSLKNKENGIANIDFNKDLKSLYHQYIQDSYKQEGILESINDTLNIILEGKED